MYDDDTNKKLETRDLDEMGPNESTERHARTDENAKGFCIIQEKPIIRDGNERNPHRASRKMFSFSVGRYWVTGLGMTRESNT